MHALKSIVRGLFTKRPLEHETSLFLLVSFLDFLMTWWLLTHRQGDTPLFVESNRVAQYFLNHWGLKGMLYFKVAMCLFITLATQIIVIRRPKIAAGILWLGVAVTGFTVVYSGALYVRHAGLI